MQQKVIFYSKRTTNKINKKINANKSSKNGECALVQKIGMEHN